MSGENRYTSPLSAVVWNNASVGINGVSAIFDSWDSPFVTIYGSSNGTTTITVLASNDGANFYQIASISATATAGSLYLNVTSGARYFQLKSSAAATITAIISAKS